MRVVLISILLAFMATSAWATDNDARLKKAIEEQRIYLQSFESAAKDIVIPHLGTAFNELGIPEYTCGAIALLLGKYEVFERVSKIEPIPDPPWTKEEDHVRLGYALLGHQNWIHASEFALGMSKRDRIEFWNLSCVGKFEIGKGEYVKQDQPRATLEVNGDQLQVFGDIYHGFFEEFESLIKRTPSIKAVVLGSGGGSVRDAILAGLLIRQRGLTTTLHADCYSACPLVFLGGKERMIWSPYPRLGFHQVSVKGAPVPPGDPIYALIERYSRDMGVDARFVLGRMLASPPDSMNHPDVWDLCTPRVTTWVQRGC